MTTLTFRLSDFIDSELVLSINDIRCHLFSNCKTKFYCALVYLRSSAVRVKANTLKELKAMLSSLCFADESKNDYEAVFLLLLRSFVVSLCCVCREAVRVINRVVEVLFSETAIYSYALLAMSSVILFTQFKR